MTTKLDAKIPDGPLAEKWDRHRFEMKLVNWLKKVYSIVSSRFILFANISLLVNG